MRRSASIRRNAGMIVERLLDHRFIFFRLERTRGIDQPPAWLKRGRFLSAKSATCRA